MTRTRLADESQGALGLAIPWTVLALLAVIGLVVFAWRRYRRHDGTRHRSRWLERRPVRAEPAGQPPGAPAGMIRALARLVAVTVVVAGVALAVLPAGAQTTSSTLNPVGGAAAQAASTTTTTQVPALSGPTLTLDQSVGRRRASRSR